MSGAEALGLACNVLTLIDCALKTVSLCKTLYHSGQARPELSNCGQAFEVAQKQLKLTLAETPRTDVDETLWKISTECGAVTAALQQELAKLELKDQTSGRWRVALTKTARAIWKKDTLNALSAKLEMYQQMLQTLLLVDIRKRSVDTEADRLEEARELSKSIQETVEALKDLQLGSVRHELYRRVLDSLFYPEVSSRQDQIDGAYKDTFQWIYGEDSKQVAFMSWLRNPEALYWVSGKPGTGKSTLMRLLCEDPRTKLALNEHVPDGEVVVLEHFIFKAGTQTLQRTITGLLRSLLYQLLASRPDLLDVVYPTKSAQIPTWTEKRLEESLLRAAPELSKGKTRLCLFVDGLDELEGRSEDCVNFLRTLSEVPRVQICVSSREIPPFERLLSKAQRVRMQDLTRDDIRTFVSGRLHSAAEEIELEHGHCELDKRAIDKLSYDVSNRADGVFLWVTLAVNSLREGMFNNDLLLTLQQRLADLPQELETLYEDLLIHVSKIYRKYVARYLRVLLAAWSISRPETITVLTLTLLDLGLDAAGNNAELNTTQLVIRCSRTRQQIISRCGGILGLETRKTNMIREALVSAGRERERLAIKEESGYQELAAFDSGQVGFAHRSLFEYLQAHEDVLEEWDGASSWSPRVSLANAYISRITSLPWTSKLMEEYLLVDIFCCLDAIKDAEIRSEESHYALVVRLDNAARNAFDAAEIRGQGRDSPTAWYQWAAIAFCHEKIWHETVPSKIYDLLGFCAAYGLTYYVKHELQQRKQDFGTTYLNYVLTCTAANQVRQNYSATGACWETVALVLEAGGDPNTSIPWMRTVGFSKPKARKEVAEELSHGDNPVPLPPSRPITPFTALLAAWPAASPSPGRDMIDTLYHLTLLQGMLDHGADVDAISTGYEQYGVGAMTYALEGEDVVDRSFLSDMRVKLDANLAAMLDLMCRDNIPLMAKQGDDPQVVMTADFQSALDAIRSVVQGIQRTLESKGATRQCILHEVSAWDDTARDIFLPDCDFEDFEPSLYNLPIAYGTDYKIEPRLSAASDPGFEELKKLFNKYGKRYQDEFHDLYPPQKAGRMAAYYAVPPDS